MWASPDLGTPHLKHFSRRLKFWTPHCEAQARPSEEAGLCTAPSKLESRDSPKEPSNVPGRSYSQECQEPPGTCSGLGISPLHISKLSSVQVPAQESPAPRLVTTAASSGLLLSPFGRSLLLHHASLFRNLQRCTPLVRP